jgi:hypothetical protein
MSDVVSSDNVPQLQAARWRALGEKVRDFATTIGSYELESSLAQIANNCNAVAKSFEQIALLQQRHSWARENREG